jgi:hypothetical protein
MLRSTVKSKDMRHMLCALGFRSLISLRQEGRLEGWGMAAAGWFTCI